MSLFLPGALPPASVAAELAKHLPQRAPALLRLLEHWPAQIRVMDPHALGCTPAEAWQLEQAGFAPAAGQGLGAGLGLLRAAQQPLPSPSRAARTPSQHQTGTDHGLAASGHDPRAATTPVWIADLVHLAIGTDRAHLSDPGPLTPDEGRQLFEAAQPWLAESPFAAHPLVPARWRIDVPAGLDAPSVSPAAVAADALHGWWPQSAALRPWRRLLNDVQMAWHEHPVNQARVERGALPVNGLWLYGGAAPWPLTAPAYRRCDALADAHQAQDWAAWLAALPEIDAAVAAHVAPPAATRSAAQTPTRGPAARLILTGADRLVTLMPKPRPALLAWLPLPRQNWNHWWSLPV